MFSDLVTLDRSTYDYNIEPIHFYKNADADCMCVTNDRRCRSVGAKFVGIFEIFSIVTRKAHCKTFEISCNAYYS